MQDAASTRVVIVVGSPAARASFESINSSGIMNAFSAAIAGVILAGKERVVVVALAFSPLFE
jgi:hypothetical protein